MNKSQLLDETSGALNNSPRLVIESEDMDKIFGYCLSSEREINGRGIVDFVGNEIRISDVFMVPQTGNSVFVRENEAALHRLLHNRFKDDLGTIARLNFQFHSHPGGVYFSGKDRENAKNLGINPLVSMVVNKDFEIYCRMDIFEPIDLSILLPVYITHKIPDLTLQQCRKEVEENDLTISGKVERAVSHLFGAKEKTIEGNVHTAHDDVAYTV